MAICKECNGLCIKAGHQTDGTQRFYCKRCKRYQQFSYKSFAYDRNCDQKIIGLLIEGIALRGIARVLQITLKAVIYKIKRIAKRLNRPYSFVKNRIFEIDELWTYVGKKENEVWLTYSIERTSKQVIDFQVGSRTKENLQKVTENVLSTEPGKVCTDGLNTYRSLIPKAIHKVGLLNTRRIERFNLNLRTHLKRLSRKTICFSKSKEMLEACLKIYFWGRSSMVI